MKQVVQQSIHPDEAALTFGMRGGGHTRNIRPTPASLRPQSKKSPTRILHVINSVGMGGTERGVLKLMDGLDPDLFDQKVCAMRSIDRDFAAFSGLNGRIILAGDGASGFQFSVVRLAEVFRRHRPHIVHSRNWGAIEAVPAALLARVPVVIHSEHGYEMETLVDQPARRRLIRRACYSLCDAVFTVSRELRSYHCRQAWFPSQRMQVITNGVDTELFAPNAEKRERQRSKLNIPPGSVVLGTVGRMVAIKNQRMIVQAAEQLIQDGNDVRLLVVGDGPEREHLNDYANRSSWLRDRTIFLGSSMHVEDAYQAMDIFALGSFKEGISNTVLEAMASAIPCVVTAVGGNPELIEHGRSGILFAAGDTRGLVAELRELVRNPDVRAQLSAAARDQAIARFSLNRMIENYEALYSGLAARRNAVVEN